MLYLRCKNGANWNKQAQQRENQASFEEEDAFRLLKSFGWGLARNQNDEIVNDEDQTLSQYAEKWKNWAEERACPNQGLTINYLENKF